MFKNHLDKILSAINAKCQTGEQVEEITIAIHNKFSVSSIEYILESQTKKVIDFISNYQFSTEKTSQNV